MGIFTSFVSALNEEQSPSMTFTKSPLHFSDFGEFSGDTSCMLKQRKKRSVLKRISKYKRTK